MNEERKFSQQRPVIVVTPAEQQRSGLIAEMLITAAIEAAKRPAELSSFKENRNWDH